MFEKELKCRCVLGKGRFSATSEGSFSRESRFFLSEAKPHFAPDRLIDVEHIKLEIAVDLKEKKLSGICTQNFKVIAPDVSLLRFDAIDLVVKKVFDAEGAELQFNQDEKEISIQLRKVIKAGQQSFVSIEYEVQEPRAGLYFIEPDQDYPDRPLQLWTQGQDQDNRYWIPCHDSPNEKATSEIVVTVDEKYTAVSNGKLIGVQVNSNLKTKTFHWKQALPHASYLITLCVGEFVEIRESWKNSRGEEIPVQYFTLPGREKETKFAFGKTPKMLDFFSKKIGIDYPYEKYAQVVAWDFIYGGMENTSATTQTEYTLHPESLELDYSSEPLVAHELAHQWFGDLLTCKEWSHAWLNEGFATYFESLWTEHEHGRDEFLYELYANEKIYKAEDAANYRRPLVTNVYLSPSDIFDRHLYEKGGRVLHMLRSYLGDELWWKGIQTYALDHQIGTVETVDLQRAFEEVSGRSLSWFFEQWVYKGGHPQIKATYEWNDEKKQIKLSLKQTQSFNDLTPFFRMPLKFKVVTSDGPVTHSIEMNQFVDFSGASAEQTFWFHSSEKPLFVSLNPENAWLADWSFEPGRDLLVAQLKNDQDVMGRIFAAKTLAKDHSRASVEALGEALKNEKFWGVQIEIVQSLSKIGSALCQEILVSNIERLHHPKARAQALKSIGLFKNDKSAEVAEKFLKQDVSPLVQYEAGLALGRSRTSQVYEKLVSALGKRESWHEYYDRGILQGLAELKSDDRVYSVLLKNTRPGLSMFQRREAVDAIAKYGVAKPTLIIEALNDLTRDANYFVRLFAIDALCSLGDDRAAAALKRIEEGVVDPRTRRAAVVALKSVREGKTSSEQIEKLKGELDQLKEQYQALLSRVEKMGT